MPPKESSVGPVIATIIILAVIVLGGLYFWGERSNNATPSGSANTQTATPTSQTPTDQNTVQGSSNTDVNIQPLNGS
jgi:hypothetical protein